MDNFNSIKVRLELVGGVPPGWSMVHFNSIKVRLERNAFYWCDLAPQFQFHKGAIRTNASAMISSGIPNFNSIKVRLELWASVTRRQAKLFQFHKGAIRTGSGHLVASVLGWFQFHKGAIRTWLWSCGWWVQADFNSIKVRLERQWAPRRLRSWVDFNSIKVRLELVLL